MVEYFAIFANGETEFLRCPRHHAEHFAAKPSVEFACLLRGGEIPSVAEVLKGSDFHPGYQLAKDFAQDNL
jgi:hypothetical protein